MHVSRSPHRRRPVAGLTLAALCGWLVGCTGIATAPSQESREPAAGAELLTGTYQLTFEGRRSGEGYFSRDGSQLVFQSERELGNPFYQIYLMDLANGAVERASTGIGKSTCGWIHPSGNRVLFASTHLDPESEALQVRELEQREEGHERRYAWDYDPHYDLFSVRIPKRDGPPVRLTSAPGYDAEASWSPNGREIAFSSNRHIYAQDGSLSADLSEADRKRALTDPSTFIDLYIMDARGANVRRLTETRGYDGGPFFSPDGKRIVFRRFSEDGATAEIYSMATDGSDVRQLTRLGALSWAPFYHPSGDYVIFTTNLHGMANFELYLVASDGSGEPVRVTQRDGFDGLPAFSPAGEELVFTRRSQDGTSQLHAARWNDALARERLGLPSSNLHAVGPLLTVPASLSPAIEPSELQSFVTALSSEAADGRLTGSAGERIATSYVARVFRSLGLEPAGDGGGYFQDFGFTAGVSLGPGNRLRASSGERDLAAADELPDELVLDRDWRPLAFSKIGEIPASEIVFAGYGIVAPEIEGVEAVDDYAHLDVADRWVLALRYVPAKLGREERRHYKRHATLRYKAMIARDRGALGILFASGPHSRVRDELVALRFDASFAGSSIAVLSLGDAAADTLVRAGSAYTLADLQKTLDEGIALPGFSLQDVRLAANIDIEQQRKQGRNVLARLPAASPPSRPSSLSSSSSLSSPSSQEGAPLSQEKAPLPLILVGAHVDHLGRGEGAGSLAGGDELGLLHPGADDNASGVAALLEIAASLSHAQTRGELESVRDIVFAAWSGEELGLLGSSAYAEKEADKLLLEAQPTADAEETLSPRIAAYLNMDMVGRLRDELALFGVDSSPIWRREIERVNAPLRIPIEVLGDSYVPTDATTFYLKGVPILSAFTGAHEDYHTPHDVPDHLNYRGLADIAELFAEITASLASSAEAPTYVATPAPTRGLPRAGLRIYLGTIPDYTKSDQTTGLALSGVAKGGPAESGGVRAGDVVIQVAGRTIENIYDYTYSLDELEVGVPVMVRVRRGDEELDLTLTPASRE